MVNANAVGPGELPVELLKLGLNHDPTVLQESHRVITGSATILIEDS